MGADGQEKGLKTVVSKLFYGNIFSDFNTGFKLYPQGFDGLNFRIDDIPREPVRRYTHGQHTAQHGKFFKYGYRVSLKRKKVGAGKPCRTGADNSDLFRFCRIGFRHKRCFVFHIHIG